MHACLFAHSKEKLADNNGLFISEKQANPVIERVSNVNQVVTFPLLRLVIVLGFGVV